MFLLGACVLALSFTAYDVHVRCPCMCLRCLLPHRLLRCLLPVPSFRLGFFPAKKMLTRSKKRKCEGGPLPASLQRIVDGYAREFQGRVCCASTLPRRLAHTAVTFSELYCDTWRGSWAELEQLINGGGELEVWSNHVVRIKDNQVIMWSACGAVTCCYPASSWLRCIGNGALCLRCMDDSDRLLLHTSGEIVPFMGLLSVPLAVYKCK